MVRLIKFKFYDKLLKKKNSIVYGLMTHT